LIGGKTSTGWNQYELNWLNQPAFNKNGTTIFTKNIGWKNIEFHNMIAIWYDSGLRSIPIVIRNNLETNTGGVFWSSECFELYNYPRCESWQRPYLELIIKENNPPLKPVIISPVNNVAQSNLDFEIVWQESIDPDLDDVNYGVELSKNQNELSQNVIFTGSKVTRHNVNIVEDGYYYYRIYAEDIRATNSKRVYSDINIIEIDSTPPEIPIIDLEPPYSYSDKNTISWSFDSNNEPRGVEFTLQQEIQNIDGTSQVQEFKTNNLGYEFTDLIEKTYCYKVKATDFLGNTSDWSEITCTKQDFTVPTITDISLSSEYISPENKDGIKDSTNLRFSISEANLLSWKLFIEDSSRNIVYTKEGNSLDFELEIPNLEFSLEEGTYFVYVIAQDEVGQSGFSEALRLIVDNTPPLPAKIVSPIVGAKLNTLSVNLSFYTSLRTSSKVLINGNEIINVSNTSFSAQIPIETLIQGKNEIVIETHDLAGNRTSTNTAFFIDTIAPQIPSLNIVQTEAGGLNLQINSSDFEIAKIYTKSGFLREVNSQSVQVVDKVTADSDYFFAVELIDSFGNKSAISEFVHLRTPAAVVLGVGTAFDAEYQYKKELNSSSCTYIYNETLNSIRKVNCNLNSPSIEKIENLTADKENYNLVVYGGYLPKIDLHMQKAYCKKKTFFDPRTWFDCFEIISGGSVTQIDLAGDLWLNVNGKPIRHAKRKTINDTSFVTTHLVKGDFSYHGSSLYADVYFSYKGPNGNWIDVFEKSGISNSVLINNAVYNQFLNRGNKYFRFPYNRIIGVTQWHGYTAFASPHTGIDFGSYQEPIYSMADGYVAVVGWDDYYGRCYSGGNYIKVTHDNGMNTFFAHLDNYKRSDGRNWQTGDRVKKNELLGVTGNSGFFACEPLGHHLHFELRKDLWQNSHVNPVDYIDIDWMLVETLGEEYYPGRLSGDNPHPTY
jgi:murein DD-endopeptidase MepM/ murein hydrolase activator NlpD